MKVKITQQQVNTKSFYGHGKLLITGEYFVLDGANALAVPTTFGQKLRIKELSSNDNTLYWVALNSKRQMWMNLAFDKTNFSCLNSDQPEAKRLSLVLTEARKQNPVFLTDKKDLAVETQLEFPNEWGLGSSSTLIHCISKWAGVDGYTLLQNTLGGSGYDVACAEHDTAILYQLQNGSPQTTAVQWAPAYRNHIYFAYTGKKQISSEAIKYYKTQLQHKEIPVTQLNAITEKVIAASNLKEFEQLMEEHETIIASQLKLEKVKDAMFADYWGSVKSLGAWGGDFVMLTNEKSEEELKRYLSIKNITTVFNWENLILNQ